MSDTQRQTFAASSPAESWKGKAVYESAVGTVALIADGDGVVPVGIVEDVDTSNNLVTVVVHGWTFAIPNADIDLDAQRVADGAWAVPADGGKLRAPAEGYPYMGFWDTKQDPAPTEDVAARFFVNITRTLVPAAP